MGFVQRQKILRFSTSIFKREDEKRMVIPSNRSRFFPSIFAPRWGASKANAQEPPEAKEVVTFFKHLNQPLIFSTHSLVFRGAWSLVLGAETLLARNHTLPCGGKLATLLSKNARCKIQASHSAEASLEGEFCPTKRCGSDALRIKAGGDLAGNTLQKTVFLPIL